MFCEQLNDGGRKRGHDGLERRYLSPEARVAFGKEHPETVEKPSPRHESQAQRQQESRKAHEDEQGRSPHESVEMVDDRLYLFHLVSFEQSASGPATPEKPGAKTARRAESAPFEHSLEHPVGYLRGDGTTVRTGMRVARLVHVREKTPRFPFGQNAVRGYGCVTGDRGADGV